MKIRSSFLFVCMAISVVLGGVSSASATSTKTSTTTAVCKSTGGLLWTPNETEPVPGISDPDDYEWILIENEVYEDFGCDFFEDYEFVTRCNNLENRPVLAELCKAEQTPMITTSDLNYLRKNLSEPNPTCLQAAMTVDSLEIGVEVERLGLVQVLPDCYTTSAEIK